MATVLPTHEVVAPKVVGVNLSLNIEEAEALATVLAKVGGDPLTTRRGVVQPILDGLYEAGIRYDTSDIEKPRTGGISSGGIYFAPRSNA